jgi:hypothetical protein
MSTALDMLNDLARGGVVLYLAADGKLKFKADPGAYTDEKRAIVAANREAFIAALQALSLGGRRPGAGDKSLPADSAPWHRDTKRVTNPAEHWKDSRKAFPPAIAPVLEAIAAAWKHGGVKVTVKENGKERTETRHPESLRREYERLAAWAMNEPETVTAAWVAEQTARYKRTESQPNPIRPTPYWARYWCEQRGEGDEEPMDNAPGSGAGAEGTGAGDPVDAQEGSPAGGLADRPSQPVPGRAIRRRSA